MAKEKEDICSYHEYIKERSRKIKKLTMKECANKKGVTTVYDPGDPLIIEEINKLATEIYDYAKLAKTAGIHMENRMREYYEGILAWGFVRKKRNKKTIDK
jgi:hypothetical protein